MCRLGMGYCKRYLRRSIPGCIVFLCIVVGTELSEHIGAHGR